MNEQAIKSSFWKLIDSKKIEIPNYQREYAQGRRNRRAEGIRTGLVQALYSALESNAPLELDFIFGGKEKDGDDTFRPVDGQQRLTILYLLHWYIFQRTGDEEALEVLKDNFSYATRTTSSTFCNQICDKFSFDWGADRVSEQIEDMSWFTGAMGYDPTVKSMLVVLDCIHKKFKSADFNDLAAKLKAGNCPITFYYYDLSDGDTTFNVRDLYIKMNARGLALTDFEIFKAEIQKTVPSDQGFDLLKGYFEKKKETDNSTARVKLIGKFNNEYTNFFFDLINVGNAESDRIDQTDTESDKFDQAMMNFINEIFRADFFCAASEKNVSQKIYREHHRVIKEMSGKELYNFIKGSGKLLIEGYKDDNGREDKPYSNFNDKDVQDAFTVSIGRIVKLLDLFSEQDETSSIFASKGSMGYSLFGDLIKGDQTTSGLAVDPLENNTMPFGDFVARNALYAFSEKFRDMIDEDKTKKNYEDWNRFVWKMVRNTDFKGFDEAVETIRGLREILAAVDDAKNLYKALSGLVPNNVTMGSSARLQFEEEWLKARLIAGNTDWESLIKEAENYFSSDGQIWFLLDLSKCDEDVYDLCKFKKAFSIAQAIFDKFKKLRTESNLFERALLSVSAYSSEFIDRDHLEQMSNMAKSSKKFVGDDFEEHLSHRYANAVADSPEKEHYIVTIKLLKTMLKDKKIDLAYFDVAEWLKGYIDGAENAGMFDRLPEWKQIFIRYDLLDNFVGGFTFKNCFEPEAWNDDKNAIAIYNTKNKRINSGELHSFALAYIIQNKNEGKVEVEYYSSQEDSYLENNFPNRYFIMKDPDNNTIKVGYRNGEYYIDGEQPCIGKTIKEAYNYLCGKSGS